MTALKLAQETLGSLLEKPLVQGDIDKVQAIIDKARTPEQLTALIRDNFPQVEFILLQIAISIADSNEMPRALLSMVNSKLNDQFVKVRKYKGSCLPFKQEVINCIVDAVWLWI